MFKRTSELLHAAAEIPLCNIDEMLAMRKAAGVFSLKTGITLTTSAAWQLLALYNEMRLEQSPANVPLAQDVLLCHARVSEENQLVELAKLLNVDVRAAVDKIAELAKALQPQNQIRGAYGINPDNLTTTQGGFWTIPCDAPTTPQEAAKQALYSVTTESVAVPQALTGGPINASLSTGFDKYPSTFKTPLESATPEQLERFAEWLKQGEPQPLRFTKNELLALTPDATESQLDASDLMLDEAHNMGAETDEEIAAVAPVVVEQTSMATLLDEEKKKQEEEDRAWGGHKLYMPKGAGKTSPAITSAATVAAIASQKFEAPKPDELINNGMMVKEYRDHDFYKSGWWRDGYPYRISVYPQPGNIEENPPEYWIHCREKPSMEVWNEHSELFRQRRCYCKVQESVNGESVNITMEYTKPTGQVGRCDMRKKDEPLGDWTEDTPYRVSFYDQRTGGRSYVYYSSKPNGITLSKYHRGKHFAVVESREDWREKVKASGLADTATS